MPHLCRCDLLRRFNAYFWVPFAWGQNDDLIQELIYACNQVIAVPGFIGNITEQLTENEEIKQWSRMQPAEVKASRLLTSSTMRVAMALPISL